MGDYIAYGCGLAVLAILVYRFGYVTAWDRSQWIHRQGEALKPGFYVLPGTVDLEQPIHLQVNGVLYRFYRETAQTSWHAPGIGEVHAFDHSFMIYCEENRPASDDGPNHSMNDGLAKKLCAHLNRTGFGVPRPEVTEFAGEDRGKINPREETTPT